MHMTTTLLWMFLVVDLTVANGETYTTFISRTAPELCPYSTFCTQGPAKRYKGKNTTVPCCSPCLCDEDCWLSDNCCPDHQSNYIQQSTARKSFMKCMIPIQFSSEETYSTPLLSSSSVYTVVSCPADYPDNDVSKNCTGKYTSRVLRDLATVSDNTGRVYKNRYCAECHGILSMNVWQQMVTCRFSPALNVLKRITTLDPDELQSLSCFLFSVAPASDKLVKRSQCYNYKYKKCNETGLWDVYNEHIEKACAAYSASYLDERAPYRNPYCYLCNKKGVINVPTKCRGIDPGRTGSLSITSLLVEMHRERSGQSTKCNSDEIYDRYFDLCRILHCPPSQEAINGHCYDVFSYIEGVAVMAVFAVTRESTSNSSIPLNTTLANKDNLRKINSLLLNALKDDSVDCYTCPTEIVQYVGYIDMFLVYVSFRSKKSCSIKNILDIFHGAYRDDIAFTLIHGDESFGFKSRLTFDMFIPMFDIYLNDGYRIDTIKGSTNRQHCLGADVLSDFFYCPSVDLSWIEYQQLMNDSSSRLHSDDFKLVINETEYATINRRDEHSHRTAYRICTGKYFPERATMNGTSKPARMSYLCLVGLLAHFILLS